MDGRRHADSRRDPTPAYYHTLERSSREGGGFQQQALERFDLLDCMDRHLFNLSGDDGSISFSLFRRTGSSTNHNHEELVEDVTDFTCKVIDRG